MDKWRSFFTFRALERHFQAFCRWIQYTETVSILWTCHLALHGSLWKSKLETGPFQASLLFATSIHHLTVYGYVFLLFEFEVNRLLQ